jgi:hypothetical protein
MNGGFDPVEAVKKGWARFQEARNQGYSVKQGLADVIAGDYDVSAVQMRVQVVSGLPPHLPMRLPALACSWQARDPQP